MTDLETSLRLYVDSLAKHGLLFPRLLRDCAVYRYGSALPRGLQRGERRQCYANAGRLILENPGWTYCEGYAIGPTAPLAVHHGWCLTEDGAVVDATWDSPELCHYLGVAFEREFCHRHWRAGVWDVWAEFPGTAVRSLPTLLPMLDARWNRNLDAANALTAR